MLLCSSVDERKVVAVFTPATCNCEPETKPVPLTVSTKLVPGAVWVTEPAVIVGSGLRILTLSEAERSRFCHRCCANSDRVTGKNAGSGRVKA